jgi:UDP-N-acetylmuramate: L-alanyl-gamma-D-glutamyl-meso-diaminopimelate ligase
MLAKMNSDPESIYSEAQDKQRVVVTGNQAAKICDMITHALTVFRHKFDYFSPQSGLTKMSDAPVIIIKDNSRPYESLANYHHHIGVVSDLEATAEIIRNITIFADATPKAGILIFSETDPTGAIGKKQRADVNAIPYSIYAHRKEKNSIVLVSSSNEQFPVALSSDQDLRSLSAAKEVLKKIGITSGEFYTAMTTLK